MNVKFYYLGILLKPLNIYLYFEERQKYCGGHTGRLVFRQIIFQTTIWLNFAKMLLHSYLRLPGEKIQNVRQEPRTI